MSWRMLPFIFPMNTWMGMNTAMTKGQITPIHPSLVIRMTITPTKRIGLEKEPRNIFPCIAFLMKTRKSPESFHFRVVMMGYIACS